MTDRDIQAIVEEEIVQVPELYNLEYLHVTTGNTAMPRRRCASPKATK